MTSRPSTRGRILSESLTKKSLILLVIARWLLAMLVLGSALSAGLVSYFYDVTPIVTGQAPESLRTWFAGSKTLMLLYLPSWMNLVGYAAGMATAFVYHYTQVEGYKLNQNKWFNLSFHAAITLGSCVVFAGVVFLRDAPPPRWAAALYAALDRTLVAMAFNVFLLGCISKCKSVSHCYNRQIAIIPRGYYARFVFAGAVFLRDGDGPPPRSTLPLIGL
ncbi:uncharacterized protein LOC135080181 [Ostrinia nubilalis]|uniref:uncharacterized protein LOC135080181 n=1 Tax=Ostrinia nubilalis TaxID=29057 RepID=UPI00308264C0